MTGPPAALPVQTDPGGIQARADGQKVEVRTHDGELIRAVPSSIAAGLVEAGLADKLPHCVRIKLGIRWLPSRLDRQSEPPDLEQMQRREPGRYAALWRGVRDAHVGKGALGRTTGDGAVRFGRCRKPQNG
jgi:hypothetical protein